jgi:hypothetical protein
MVFNVNLTIFQVYRVGQFLLVGETRENHRPAANHRRTLSNRVVSSTPRHERDSNSQL